MAGVLAIRTCFSMALKERDREGERGENTIFLLQINVISFLGQRAHMEPTPTHPPFHRYRIGRFDEIFGCLLSFCLFRPIRFDKWFFLVVFSPLPLSTPRQSHCFVFRWNWLWTLSLASIHANILFVFFCVIKIAVCEKCGDDMSFTRISVRMLWMTLAIPSARSIVIAESRLVKVIRLLYSAFSCFANNNTRWIMHHLAENLMKSP